MSDRKALGTKVAVLGGAGGIGQSFCLLLKQSPLISALAIYDLVGASGVAVDLSHVNTRCTVTGYGPDNNGLAEALTGAHVVVITAGKAQQPGKTMEDLFNANAPILVELVTSIAKYAPNAMICVITNPINSLVPIAARVMLKYGALDTRRIFGVLSLDVMRASLFAAKNKNLQLGDTWCPIVGGHSEKSTVPIFSQIRPATVTFTEEEQAKLTQRVKTAIFEVINAKAGTGSATLSMAHAAYHFVQCLLEAMHGVPGVVECAFVRSDITDAKFFCSPLLLGNGIEANLGIGPVNELEKEYLAEAIEEVKKDVKIGEDWIARHL